MKVTECKTVSLRIATFKDENGELIPKFEKQLSALGITMRDTTTGQILPTFDILQQVGEKFKGWDKNTQLDVSQLLGGKLQANVVSSVLNNVNELNRAYGLAQNSSNSALNEFKTYQQGIQYSIDQLKESISNMYKESMNSSSVKSFVDILTKLISTFGNLKTVVAIASTAFLVFKGQAITSAIASLGSYMSTLFSVVKAEGALTVATSELDIALSTNPFGLIAMAITGVIVVMDALTASQNNLKQSNAEYVQSLQNSNPNQGQELLDNYKHLQSELSTLKQGTEEYKNKEQELATAQQSLISLYPQASTVIDENTGKKRLNADATQKLIDKDKELAQAKAIETLSNNKISNADDVTKMVEEYKKAQEEMNKLTEDYNNGVANQEVIKMGANGPHKSSVSTSKQLEETTKEYEDYKQKILAVQSALGFLDGKNTKFAGSLDKVNNAMKNSSDETDDNTKAVNDNTKAKNDNANTDTEQDKAQAVAQATEEYNKSTQAIAQAQGYIDKLNKAQAVTPTLAKQISKTYQDVGTDINSYGETIEFLKGKIQEQQEAQENALMILKGDDEQFYADKVANNQAYENQINNFLANFTGNSENAYSVDLSNFSSLNQMKAGVQDTLKSAVDSFMSQFVNTSAEGYKIDYANFSSLINAKKEVMKAMAGSMAQFWDETSQGFTEQAYGGIDLSGGASNEQYEAYTQKANGILKIRDSIRSAESKLDGIYAGGGLNFQGFDGGGGASDFSGTGGGSGGKGGSGKSAEDEAKKAQEEAEKAEKASLKKITDAYDDAKEKINDDLKDIELNEKQLGKASNDNFPQRVQYSNDKIKEQQDLLNSATNQLMDLETQSYSTQEGQDALADAIKKANTEIKEQKIAVEEARQSLQDLLQEQAKQVIEQEKNVAELQLEGKQAYDTKRLEDYTKQQEDAHNTRMDALDAELTELEKQNEEEDKANELQEKKNDLKQKEIDLERVKNQQTIQTYSKDANGNWNFSYTYDKTAYESKLKEVDEAKKSLEDTRRQQEYEEEKQAIEDQKTAEEDLYKKKEDYLKQYSDNLKEAQDLEKERLDNYYSDMDKLAKDRLAGLEQQYGDNWDAIAKAIQTKLTETQDKFNTLTTIKLNFGVKAVQEAINSGDTTQYLLNKKDEIDKSTKLDLAGIDSYIKSIDNSAQQLSETYDDVLSVVNSNKIIDEDITNRQTQVNKLTEIDSNGLSQQLKNLQDTDAKLEAERNSHYDKKLARQNQAQADEMTSVQKFAQSYLLFTNKFLEMLQIVYDFRFNNITTNVTGAVNEIVEGLQVIAEAYAKYASAWNTMHPDDEIPSSINIASVTSANSNYQKSVTDYQSNKLALYSADAFEKYASQIGDGISKNLFNSLNSYSSSLSSTNSTNNLSTVNNKSTSSVNTTTVSINQLDVNTKDAQNLLNQLLTIVNNKTNLS